MHVSADCRLTPSPPVQAHTELGWQDQTHLKGMASLYQCFCFKCLKPARDIRLCTLPWDTDHVINYACHLLTSSRVQDVDEKVRARPVEAVDVNHALHPIRAAVQTHVPISM